MNRDLCARLIKERLTPDTLVLGAMGSSGRAWRAQKPDQLSYFVLDPMGMALPMALGLALAQPGRNVVLLGGDGDFLTGMSALVAVADADPGNLKIGIFNSDRYESGGGQPLPAAGKISLATLGRGAGLAWSEEATKEDALPATIDTWLRQPGPALLVFRVAVAASPYPPAPPWAKAEDRAVFMRQLHGEG